ncbi:MAG: phosphoglycerate dehydrogenase [Acidobacteriota bacterium]
MYRILVSDPLEKTGLAMLRESGHQVDELTAEDKHRLPEILPEYDALVVRSGTQVTAELLKKGTSLKVVGRAGIGVDNVDTKAATQLGILVVNAPTANLISATEHTFALLLAVARNVTKADADLRSGQWNRKKWVGAELQGKTLGIIGYGRIGQQVARRARAFDMKIVAYDPFLSDEVVRRAEAEPMELDAMLGVADVVTLHVPLTDETRDILNAERLPKMKEGAVLINCARGGTVDEDALYELLESGHIAGAGLDVFAQEPPEDYRLARHPRVVATPHLGAQTQEAQVRISTQTARMVVAALGGSLEVSAVNLPFRPAGSGGTPWLRLGEKLGRLASSLADGELRRVEVLLHGVEESLHVPVSVAAIKGALTRSMGEGVNYVNAESIAVDRGVEIRRVVAEGQTGYPNQLQVRLVTEERTVTAAGTLFEDGDGRVVSLDGYRLEFRPKGSLLVVRNEDIPGVVGQLGTVLGDARINIAEIHLARERSTDDRQALAVVRLDHSVAPDVLDRVRSLPAVIDADPVDLGDA